MSEDSVREWLREGITAVKNNDLVQGRKLLEAVLEVDERNETAWLWLSGAVETADERQICLENVLAINPENDIAKKGLARLTADSELVAKTGKTQTVTRHYAPLSTASAILYPESQTKTWQWKDPTAVSNVPSTVSYQSSESYSDIWTKEVPMCGYCAHELADEDTRCPHCRKELTTTYFRYPKPSPNLTMFWVLLLGVGQFLMLQIIYNILAQKNLYAAVGNGFVMVAFFILAVAVNFRQFWAYITAIYLLSSIILVTLLRWIIPANLATLGLENYDPAIQDFILPLTSGLGGTIRIFILAGALLALFYAIFKAGPDFDRQTVREVATLIKEPKTAVDFNAVAKRLARRGLWATAVLHWQRAAAKAPQHIAYQESLGRAYAKLGFYERSLDVLQSAHKRSGSAERQAAIQQLIQAVQAKMAHQSQQAKQN
jgi:tetratricopeptide (TPR) repeat protein